MNLYIAVGSADLFDLVRSTGQDRILVSFFYLMNRPKFLDKLYQEKKKDKNLKLFLDSGGFTLRQKSAKNWERLNVPEHCSFLNDHKNIFRRYSILDPISARQTYKNYLKYKEHNLGVAFVDQVNPTKPQQPYDILEQIYKNDPKVCIGGVASVYNVIDNFRTRWFLSLPKEKQNEIKWKGIDKRIELFKKYGTKVHIFACYNQQLLKYAHFDSVDSASWIIHAQQFGLVDIFRLRRQDDENSWGASQFQVSKVGVPKEFKDKAKSIGLDLTKDIDRSVWNVKFFQVYFKALTEFHSGKKNEAFNIIKRSLFWDEKISRSKGVRKSASMFPSIFGLDVIEEISTPPSSFAIENEFLKSIADPYQSNPDENETYKYVVQHHWRGKSVHADCRLEGESRAFLIGWTLDDLISGVIDKPVLTLADAKREDANDNNFKINWSDGSWARRARGENGTLQTVNINTERKAVEPKEWLEYEGATDSPEEGKPIPAGATANFPGVFHIIDKGTVEYGCFPPKEQVLTADGLKEISKVEIGEYLLGDNNEWVRVVSTFKRRAKSLVTLHIRGLQELTLTPNHKVWGVKRDKKQKLLKLHHVNSEWIKAIDLESGDFIAIPKIKKEEKVYLHLKERRTGLERELEIQSEIAWLLGFFMGDGHASPVIPQSEFKISDERYCIKTENILHKYFDCNIKLKMAPGCISLMVNSATLNYALRKIFYKEGQKIFPVELLFLHKKYLLEFMTGYYAADGRKMLSEKKQLELTTTSQEMFKLSHLAIAKLGTVAGGTSKRSHALRLCWLKKYLDLLDGEISTTQRRAIDYLEDEKYFYLRIKNIKKKPYNGLVYNLETEDHTIYTPFRTHNSQKPYSHEYFFHGKALNYKVVIRLLNLDSQKFLSENNLNEYFVKADVIRPSETKLEGFVWLAIKPDDQTPYVISKAAVDKGWMPPEGMSALPKEVRDRIPEEYKYWLKGSDAPHVRDAFVAKIKEDEKAGNPFIKAAGVIQDFILSYQWWRGPIVIRQGASDVLWHLFISQAGSDKYRHVTLGLDPLTGQQVWATVESDAPFDLTQSEGFIKPGTKLNPSKDTPSWIKRLDAGKAIVMSDEKGFKKFEFKGGKLKGLYILQSEAEGSDIFTFGPSDLPNVK